MSTDELGHLEIGIQEVMSEQLAIILIFNRRRPQLDVAESLAMADESISLVSMMGMRVVGEIEAWRRCEDVLGLIIAARWDNADLVGQ
ncbi:hypothetical protein CLAFUW4_02156 [Fulvia fulva]|uniref:Uncharacterized protein n=1 Tax=Passalora fulva TaxID=5499 RepID=A0A9Q8L6M1_PASFU|nr:uncharacterized protein CLAFUR5_02147 [Fulvia fulva]KAK4635124.1 hypothetical protein CLAFUR4_02152 [Fulvia fulva]KAK4636904.1 hypothetical protein CLAFUR0_02155 [Fulvia fulva]UJO11841.1 hypothetical protein CLAFUR5_02147 [Fulvia fulva]WPV08983.1 hypothetical protein CLAFUW4_02156 [Fulvia fulva]WPV23588.1 hypothetical protein CLAFUW7_02156 [Fulvia fulva]